MKVVRTTIHYRGQGEPAWVVVADHAFLSPWEECVASGLSPEEANLLAWSLTEAHGVLGS